MLKDSYVFLTDKLNCHGKLAVRRRAIHCASYIQHEVCGMYIENPVLLKMEPQGATHNSDINT